MVEIVGKLTPAPERGPLGPTEAPHGALDRDIHFRVSAQTLGGQQKRAEVWSEVAGQRTSSTWSMLCDEGMRLGGEDGAPSPLAYFSAGIAF